VAPQRFGAGHRILQPGRTARISAHGDDPTTSRRLALRRLTQLSPKINLLSQTWFVKTMVAVICTWRWCGGRMQYAHLRNAIRPFQFE
jgi:hypothetical protein